MLRDTKCRRHKEKREGAVQEEFETGNIQGIFPSLNQPKLVRTTYKCFGPDTVSVWNAKQICACQHFNLQLTKQTNKKNQAKTTTKWQKHLLSGFSGKSSLCVMTDPLVTTV